MIEIEILTPGSASVWFAVLRDTVPPDDWMRGFAPWLEGGPLAPHLRMVVKQDGRPFGRFAAQVKEGVIACWNPTFRDGTPPALMEEVMRLLAAKMPEIRREVALEHLVIENRNGDDIEHNDLWRKALRHEGYVETTAFRVYALPLEDMQDCRRAAPGCSIHQVDALGEDNLIALYGDVRACSLNQRDCDDVVAAIQYAKEMARGYHAPTWLIASVDGRPAAYVMANLADEEEFGGPSAWIISIGCLPACRGKGISSILLADVANRVKSAGARTLLACIDHVNVPSIRLHTSFGLKPQRDEGYVYQLK